MSVAACADLVRRGDPDRFLAAMAAPPAARAVLFPIYAANLEIARAPWMSEEPMIAEMRLQWWRDALDEIGQGGPVRRHEVTTPLADLLDGDGAALLERLAAARRWDIYKDAFEGPAEFDAYLDATAAGLLWAAARALGAPEAAEPALRDIGWSAGLAGFFKAIPELEAKGRRPLVDGRSEAVAALAERGLSRLARGRAALRTVPKLARPALYPAWQTAALLTQARADPARVGEGTLGLSEFRRRAGLIRTSLTGRV